MKWLPFRLKTLLDNMMTSYFWLCFISLYILNQTHAQVRCKSNEFQCKFTGVCIEKINLCDGTQDCSDRSDETEDECKYRSCSRKLDYGSGLVAVAATTDFRCTYGACIASHFVCDGFINCLDESDETNQLCQNRQCDNKQFKCKYGACIDNYYKCNGRTDCADGSDETKELCLTYRKTCNSRQFRCSYGPCIHSRLKCNGRADCADDSDEVPSLCGSNHNYRSATTNSGNLVTFKPTPAEIKTTTKENNIPVVPIQDSVFPTPSSSSHSNEDGKLSINLLKEILGSSGYDGDLISGIFNAVGEAKIKDVSTDSIVPLLPAYQETTELYLTTMSPKNLQPGLIIFPDSLNDNNASLTHLGPCEDNLCRCGHPYEFFCILCQEEQNMKDVCMKIGEENVCDIQVEEEDTVDILSCGIPFIFTNDVSAHQRVHKEVCLSDDGVPVLTSVLANCWGTTSMILTCQPDGQWLPYGVNDSRMSMSRICQPSGVDSKVCGRFQFMKADTPQFPINQWPFLVGIFDGPEKFICTGAIIASQWLLTAAHCFPSYKLPSFNVSSYRIQHALSQEMDSLANLTEVYLHPNFSVRPYLASDLALLKLSELLIFSSDLFPVCVDREETLFGHYAATFIRRKDEMDFHWSLSREILDPSCFTRESVCARHLIVGESQFCSRKPDRINQLEPGSSGGPYLINKGPDNDDQWTVAGVVSYNLNTPDCPDYNVFSSVAIQRGWIDACVDNGNCY